MKVNKKKLKKISVLKSNYLRSDAVPDVTFILAKFEYCARALALWAAAVSTAETLLNPAAMFDNEFSEY